MNRLLRGAQRLSARMEATSSQDITYTRGATTLEVKAVLGRHLFAFVNPAGADERVATTDFIVTVAALASLGEPERGDRVRFVDPVTGDTHLHEVLAPNAEPHWRWADEFHTAYRIHTKFIRTEVGS